jgi:hypothetical protein
MQNWRRKVWRLSNLVVAGLAILAGLFYLNLAVLLAAGVFFTIAVINVFNPELGERLLNQARMALVTEYNKAKDEYRRRH